MAGAVEKRKATLAAKKAAQAAQEQKIGFIAPKPKSHTPALKITNNKNTPMGAPTHQTGPAPAPMPALQHPKVRFTPPWPHYGHQHPRAE